MRGMVRAAIAAAGLLVTALGTTSPAGASLAEAPTPTQPAAPAAAVAVPGKPVCTIQDSRLIELSGMAATDNGYVVMNDFSETSSRNRVFVLDKACKVVGTPRSYPNNNMRDPEDLAIGKDGTIWVADIGDNAKNRTNIGVWKFPATGNAAATLYRLRYPDGKHDAEAILLDQNDQPIIVTKSVGVSNLYMPSAALAPSTSNSQGVLLKKVGEFKPQRTGTSTLGGLLGQLQITGGSNSPDRSKVVLRTYGDAYEWDVPDGDVVKAITTGKPRVTPLPDEPWGEAITYSRDGATFLTVSETVSLPAQTLPVILQYSPATEVKPTPTAGPGAAPKRNTLSWFERLSLTQATSLIAAIGLVGVLLVVIGVFGIMQGRRRNAKGKDGDTGGGKKPRKEKPAGVANAVGHAQPVYRSQASRDADWRGDSGYAGTQYAGSQYAGTEYAAGGYAGTEYAAGYQPGEYGDPQGYGEQGGYPPPPPQGR